MRIEQMKDCLERCPVIAAVRENQWEAALEAPTEVLFLLKGNLLTVKERIEAAHAVGKYVFVHVDLADGVGKDRIGIRFLADCGADGIISTRGQLIRMAKDTDLLTVQRFFALDSQGLDSIGDQLENSAADLIEIMPGVLNKAVERFAHGAVPVIAGGLIETKAEVTAALSCGAAAVSTGKQELWYL